MGQYSLAPIIIIVFDHFLQCFMGAAPTHIDLYKENGIAQIENY